MDGQPDTFQQQIPHLNCTGKTKNVYFIPGIYITPLLRATMLQVNLMKIEFTWLSGSEKL